MIADERILGLPKVSLTTKELLPEYSGIYYVIDQNNVVMYIGKAKNIKKRWQGKSHHRIHQLKAIKNNHFYLYFEQINESQLDPIEKQLIQQYQPELNASQVKSKKNRPAESLVRESLRTLDQYILILGIIPDEKIIKIIFDFDQFRKDFKLDINTQTPILKSIFSSRKCYTRQWDFGDIKYYGFIGAKILVNGYEVRINTLNSLHLKYIHSIKEIPQEASILLGENIPRISQNTIDMLLHQSSNNQILSKVEVYPDNLLSCFFDELIPSKKDLKLKLDFLNQKYQLGEKGVGSRSKIIQENIKSIHQLIEEKNRPSYSQSRVLFYRGNDSVGLYVYPFCFDILQTYNSTAYGKINNEFTAGSKKIFDLVYLLTGSNMKIWKILEAYIADFSALALHPSEEKFPNNHGYTQRFWVSQRKYLQPAKMKIKFEGLSSGFGIPFGQDVNQKFTTFEAAKTEIIHRLNEADLPPFKLTFTPEKIVTKGRR